MGLIAGLVPVLLASLPLALWVVVTLRQGHVVSSRRLPADVARITVMVAFVAWVNPFWGICAALAAYHWLQRGWTMVEGAYLWPTMAMAAALGLHADLRWLHFAVAFALVVGVVETAVALCQFFGVPIFLIPGMPMLHGTIGHRTGLGMYLAVLLPLGFLTDYGWVLAAIYGIGLFLSWSLMAWIAVMAGLTILMPTSVFFVWPVAVIGILLRLVKWTHRPYPKLRHWGDSWGARWRLWGVTLRRLGYWPRWCIGYGAFAFASDSRQWMGRERMTEFYEEAHNDYVEFAYEYGMLGCAAMTGWAVTLYPAVAFRDPVTASAAALGVTMLGQFPLRVAPVLGMGGLVIILLMRRLG